MNCQECRGACCETMLVPNEQSDPDTELWLGLRVVGPMDGERLALRCKCSALTEGGACEIYQARPMICRAFEAGGADCLETVRLTRTPEEYARIRDEDDPAEIHA